MPRILNPGFGHQHVHHRSALAAIGQSLVAVQPRPRAPLEALPGLAHGSLKSTSPKNWLRSAAAATRCQAAGHSSATSMICGRYCNPPIGLRDGFGWPSVREVAVRPGAEREPPPASVATRRRQRPERMGRLPTGHCLSTARRARPSGTPVIRPTRPPRRPAPARARGAGGGQHGAGRGGGRGDQDLAAGWFGWHGVFAPGVRLGFLQEAPLPQSSAAVNGFSANASTAMTRRPTASSLCTLGGWSKSSDASPQVGQSLKAADGRRPCPRR